MDTVELAQAEAHLSELIEAALRGEEVVISRDGVPAVRLAPVRTDRLGRDGGWLRGRVKIVDPDWDKPDPELERLFYDSVIFPEGERTLKDEAGKGDAAPR